jgi:adenylate kinase family enzyme
MRLADILELPLIHLDQYFWKPGWVPSLIEDFAIDVKALAERDQWIMDGNYGRTLGHRLPRADHVVYVGCSGFVCSWAFLRRAVTWRGRQRPDMGIGCPDLVEWKMIWSVLRQQRGHQARTLARVKSIAPDKPVTLVRSRSEAKRLLASIGNYRP